MKRLLSFLAAGTLVFALTDGATPQAEAGQTNFTSKRTNFKSGRRPSPPRIRQKKPRKSRDGFRFFGILDGFGGPPRRIGGSTGGAGSAGNGPKVIVQPGQPGVQPGQPGQPGMQVQPVPPVTPPRKERVARPKKPKLLAPDAPVEEYVEKPKIYVYPEVALVPLRQAGLGGSPIARVLGAGLARVEVEPEHKKAIINFYKKRGFAPVWTSGGISARAQDVLALLADAGKEGLNSAHYQVPVVWEAMGDVAQLSGDPIRLARLDVELTAMALRYARHLSGGVVNPNLMSTYHDLRPPKVSPAKALAQLADNPNPAAWLASLAPKHRAYALMKKELHRLSGGAPKELLPAIPMGKLIRPGNSDARLPLIRQHLRKLGVMGQRDTVSDEMVQASPTAGEGEMSAEQYAVTAESGMAASAPAPNVYDKQMERAVRRFQKMAGLKPDGLIGKGTIRALNRRNSRDTTAERRRKLKLNMERMRWMPRDWGNPYFLVNQPAYELYLVEDGRVAWKTRVIIGKPKNQTYFFSHWISIVVFNPYWGVPQSIIRKEFIPKLMKNPAWLDKEGYEVRDIRGRVISSTQVDWAKYRNAEKIPFDIRQLPGDDNALGRLKVLFPNKHAIYLHDTPFKSLFKHRRRAYSHGCVRVQDPRKLAELVTGLDPFEIEQRIAANKNKVMKLKKRIRVHLAYFTAWPDENGKMRYYSDVYGRDKLLSTALKKHHAAYARMIRSASAR